MAHPKPIESTVIFKIAKRENKYVQSSFTRIFLTPYKESNVLIRTAITTGIQIYVFPKMSMALQTISSL